MLERTDAMKKNQGAQVAKGKVTPQEETGELIREHMDALRIFGRLPGAEIVSEDEFLEPEKSFVARITGEHGSDDADDSLVRRVLKRKK